MTEGRYNRLGFLMTEGRYNRLRTEGRYNRLRVSDDRVGTTG